IVAASAPDCPGHHPIRAVQVTVGPVLKKVASGAMDNGPAIGIDASGTVRVAFSRYGQGTLVAPARAGGTWSSTLAPSSFDDRWLDAAIGGNGQFEVAV